MPKKIAQIYPAKPIAMYDRVFLILVVGILAIGILLRIDYENRLHALGLL
jgi:hypothetical protein